MFLFLPLFSLSSCRSRQQNPFVEGVYEHHGKEIENANFSKAKIVLSLIDKETFLSKNDKNVIEDYHAKEDKKYYSIELYLFLLNVNDYVQYDVFDFDYSQGVISWKYYYW